MEVDGMAPWKTIFLYKQEAFHFRVWHVHRPRDHPSSCTQAKIEERRKAEDHTCVVEGEVFEEAHELIRSIRALFCDFQHLSTKTSGTNDRCQSSLAIHSSGKRPNLSHTSSSGPPPDRCVPAVRILPGAERDLRGVPAEEAWREATKRRRVRAQDRTVRAEAPVGGSSSLLLQLARMGKEAIQWLVHS